MQPMQGLPSPLINGWQMCDNMIIPVLMTKEAAPVGIMELTVCKCEKSSCRPNHHCICRKKTRSHALKDAGAWVMRAAKIHILYAPINVKPEGGDPGHMWGI